MTDPDHETTPDITVTVRRTGGIAGITREWRASSPAVTVLPSLVDACPWPKSAPRDPEGAPQGADRYAWIIQASSTRAEREVRISDRDLVGPWRVLVDTVRDAD